MPHYERQEKCRCISMNKFIKELAKEAGFDEYNGSLIKEGRDCEVYVDNELEKFAELIIEMCMEIVINSDPSPKMVVHEPYRTIVENIKDYFWYEEDIFEDKEE